MVSCGKITLYILIGFIIYIIISAVYLLYFSRYDFESQNAFGLSVKDEVDALKERNPNFDEKTCKAVLFSTYLLSNAPKSLLTKFTLVDGSKLSEEQYNSAKRKLDSIILSNDSMSKQKAARDYIDCFVEFPTSKSDDKIIFNLNEDERKFIKENTETIKGISEYSSSYFTEDCVKYLTENNLFISDSDKTSFFAFISARYAKFATL